MFAVPVWLAEALGSLVLAGICLAVYVKTHERFMGHWLIGWVLAMPGTSPVSSGGFSLVLLAYELLRIAASYFLLLGNHEFHERPFPQRYRQLAAVTAGWVLVGFPALYRWAPQPYYLSVLAPPLAFQSAAFIASGLLFLRSKMTRPFGRKLAGWGYVMMGVHLMDYPFLYRLPGNDRWGYLTALVLGMSAALGSFLAYFEKRDQPSVTQQTPSWRKQVAFATYLYVVRQPTTAHSETVFLRIRLKRSYGCPIYRHAGHIHPSVADGTQSSKSEEAGHDGNQYSPLPFPAPLLPLLPMPS